MKQIVIFIFSLLVCVPRLAAQEVKGIVTDRNHQPVEAATVIMQTSDSTFVDGVITDSLGQFSFHHQLDRYRLIFQHVMYKSLIKEYKATEDAGTIMLEAQDYALGEVTVRAERPLVKAENGALIYDVAALTGKSAAGNAYEW